MRDVSMVVSMRLHALIFAAGQGVPVVGISYDPKVSGFMDYLDQKNYVTLEDVLAEVPMRIPVSNTDGSRVVSYIDGTWRVLYTKANGLGFYMSGTTVGIGPDLIKNVSGTDYYTSYSDNIERSCPFSTTALVPEQSIYNTTYTYDFYDVGTYLDCSVGCYFGVVGSSKPIYWSATTQVTIPKL